MDKPQKTLNEEKLDRAHERLRRLEREVEDQKRYIAGLEARIEADRAEALMKQRAEP